jgi:tripartite ATP-independent transporter DctM subunit
MLGGVLLGVMSGYPLAIVVGSVGFFVGILVLGDKTFPLMYSRIYELTLSYPLLAVPLFTFMGVMLERSGIADGLYDALYLWFGGLRGGLAISTVLFGTILAACLGVIAASVTMLSIIALSPMVKRGYNKAMATGAVCAGGTLGILIPPSVMLVVYGPMADISVGQLFMAAVVPGLLLSALYSTYIGVRCLIQPNAGPAVPASERAVPLPIKLKKLTVSLAPTAILILAVLGSIFFGIAPPTEAAAVGAFASIVLAIGYRKFSFDALKKAALETFRVSAFAMLIGALSYAFVGVFVSAGCGQVVVDAIMSAPGGKWGVFMAIMFIMFILGMFIDWIGIVFIMVPILTPVAAALQFDPLWFGMMICINLQMAFLTPPFAGAIFVCRGTAPSDLGIQISDIMRGVLPYVGMVVLCLVLCAAFPQLILWLPGKMIVGW